MSRPALSDALWTCVLLFAVCTAGCSHLAFDVQSDRPEWSHAVAAEEQSGSRGDRSSSDVGTKQEVSEPTRPGEYHIVTDDQLEVGIFALEEPGKIKTLARTVSLQGNVTLPWVGPVSVKGCTVPEAEQRIAEAYDGRFIKDPQVTVNVVERHGAAVVVTGAVEEPGLYPLRPGHTTVLDLLSSAGGVTRYAGDHVLLFRRSAKSPQEAQSASDGAKGQSESEAIRINLSDLMDTNNARVNRTLTTGDILTVPQHEPRYVSIMGYVGRPGAYELPEEQKMSALEAVAHAGGLTSMARPGNSYVLRQTEKGQKARPVDLSKVAKGEAPPLYLREGDVLLVGTSTASQAAEFIRPAARVSANATVSP